VQSTHFLAGKPLIPTHEVGACLGNSHSGSTIVASGYDFEYRTCANLFEIRRANDCSLHFLSPQPDPEALRIIYPSEYIPFHFHELRGPVRWARDLVQRGKARAILRLAGEGGYILDVGTGSGILLRLLARMGTDPATLWANDFSAEVLSDLSRQGFQILTGPAESLQTDKRFRVICLNQVLEHLQNPVAVINRLSRLIEKGGHLFIETPSTEGIDFHFFRRRYWGGYHFPRHFWLFNEASLKQLLEQAGLRIAEVRYLCSPAFWIQSFHHALLDKGWPRFSRFFSEKNPLLLAPFTALDFAIIGVRGKTSNIRIVAQKVA
jgi:ubiquinone/menaquinone biosynthesis C-methylase UbiE